MLFSHNYSKSTKQEGRAMSPDASSRVFQEMANNENEMKVNFRNFLEREIEEQLSYSQKRKTTFLVPDHKLGGNQINFQGKNYQQTSANNYCQNNSLEKKQKQRPSFLRKDLSPGVKQLSQ